MATQQVKSASYFPHDSNARHDEKIIRLRMRCGAAGYGVYFMILERLQEENDYMSVKDYNMIAFDLRVDAAIVKSVVEDFGLFVFTEDGKYFYSESFNRRMNAKDTQRKTRSESAKIGARARWGKAEQDKPAIEPQPIPTKNENQTEANNQACLKRFFGKANQINLEVLLINLGLHPNDMNLLQQAAKDGVAEWEIQARTHENYTDWSQHMISTLRIKVKDLKAKGVVGQTPPTPADYDYGGGFGSKDI